jgi:hypothetical protein
MKGNIDVYLYHLSECPEYHRLIHLLASRTSHSIRTYTVFDIGDDKEEVVEYIQWYIPSRNRSCNLVNYSIILLDYSSLCELKVTDSWNICRLRPESQLVLSPTKIGEFEKFYSQIYLLHHVVILNKPDNISTCQIASHLKNPERFMVHSLEYSSVEEMIDTIGLQLRHTN